MRRTTWSDHDYPEHGGSQPPMCSRDDGRDGSEEHVCGHATVTKRCMQSVAYRDYSTHRRAAIYARADDGASEPKIQFPEPWCASSRTPRYRLVVHGYRQQGGGWGAFPS
nr:hypothetical protein CFP56_60269 [Quercus suber]